MQAGRLAFVLAEVLETYHTLQALNQGGLLVYSKAGVRDHGVASAALELLLGLELSGKLLDATFTAGRLAAAKYKTCSEVVVIETSRAALRAASKTFAPVMNVKLAATPLWDDPGEFDHVLLIPQTDKGTARVEAELRGAFTQLQPGGVIHMVMHKDQGAKRYERLAKRLFGQAEVIAKRDGWRLTRAVRKEAASYEIQPLEFQLADLTLQAAPGVYAAGKLDPGTAFLLEVFDIQTVLVKSVLDMGCGYGLISLKAALAGAAVTALDDDLLAVRATYQNAKRYGLDIRCLHSDINSQLADETFDLVLMNPPFHIAKQVRLELPTAFIAAAYAHLKPGAELVLVANKALPYEKLLAAFSHWETIATNSSFKVLRAVR